MKRFDIVVDRDNFQSLVDVVASIDTSVYDSVCFVLPEPQRGQILDDFDKKYPRVPEVWKNIDEAVRKAEEIGLNVVSNDKPFNYMKPNWLLDGFDSVEPSFVVKKFDVKPKISVIIPTANRYKHLRKTLLSLFDQTISKEDYEIVVVDDDSDDNTLDMIKSLDIPVNFKYIFWGRKEKFVPGEPMNRVGPVRNLGVKWADAEVVLFVDCDVCVCPELVSEHLKTRTDSKDVVIGLYPKEDTHYDPREGYLQVCDDDPMKLAIPWLMAFEGNISLDREKYISNSGFSSDFVYWGFEGDEFALRLLRKGFVIKLNRKAMGWHQHHEHENIDYETAQRGHKYNAEVFYKKHPFREVYLRFWPGFMKDESEGEGLESDFANENKIVQESVSVKIDDRNCKININDSCNNKCIFCDILKKKPENVVSIDDIKKAIKENKDKKIVLRGSEPTLRKDFPEILRILRESGTESELVTNARIFAVDKYAKMITSVIKNYLVTLYSADPKVHDSITQVKGSFEQTLQGIINMKKYGVGIAGTIVLCEKNYLGVSELLSLLKKLGINSVNVVIVRAFLDETFGLSKYFKHILDALVKEKDNFKFRLKYDFFECIPHEYRYDLGRLLSREYVTKDFEVRNIVHCQFCPNIKVCKGKFDFLGGGR